MKIKRLTSIFLALCIFALGGVSVLTARSAYVSGDADGDGYLTVKDAACIQLYIAKLYNGYINLSACDANEDGDFNIADAAYIQLKLARLSGGDAPSQETTISTTQPATEATIEPATQSVASEPVTKPANGGFNENYARQVVELINKERAAAGLSPVAQREDMNAIAKIRAKEITVSFSHTRPNGQDCFSIAKEQGIAYRYLGENIAYGQKTPEAVMTGWMNSSGHRANILSENFDGVGVAAYKYNGTYYWVQYFIGSR